MDKLKIELDDKKDVEGYVWLNLHNIINKIVNI